VTFAPQKEALTQNFKESEQKENQKDLIFEIFTLLGDKQSKFN
jgi:hypothetical protein